MESGLMDACGQQNNQNKMYVPPHRTSVPDILTNIYIKCKYTDRKHGKVTKGVNNRVRVRRTSK